jgi:hypothetical protein
VTTFPLTAIPCYESTFNHLEYQLHLCIGSLSAVFRALIPIAHSLLRDSADYQAQAVPDGSGFNGLEFTPAGKTLAAEHGIAI